MRKLTKEELRERTEKIREFVMNVRAYHGDCNLTHIAGNGLVRPVIMFEEDSGYKNIKPGISDLRNVRNYLKIVLSDERVFTGELSRNGFLPDFEKVGSDSGTRYMEEITKLGSKYTLTVC